MIGVRSVGRRFSGNWMRRGGLQAIGCVAVGCRQLDPSRWFAGGGCVEVCVAVDPSAVKFTGSTFDEDEVVLTRLADWEGISKSRTLRDFDTSATRIVAKCETVDTYYRRCCSALYVGNVMVPLLCISALDDPICTKEAIPWDECRGNKNVVLAETQHGGHLAYFEGITAKSLWWVRAVDEFLAVLHSSPLSQMKKEIQMQVPCSIGLEELLRIDKAPYVNVGEYGKVAGIGNAPMMNDKFEDKVCVTEDKSGETRYIAVEGEAWLEDGNDIGMVPVRRRLRSNATSGDIGIAPASGQNNLLLDFIY